MPKTWIIGGGMAGLVAAFELTEPGRVDPADVTIIQPGWRLGGKCASGHTPDAQARIEEHGLHIWFGSYDNAIWLMRRCYDELARDETVHAIATIEDAFRPCDTALLWQNRNVDEADWADHELRLPRSPPRPLEFVEVVRTMLDWALRRLMELQYAQDDGTLNLAEVKATPRYRQARAESILASLGVSAVQLEASAWREVLKGVVTLLAHEAAYAFTQKADDIVDPVDVIDLLDAFADQAGAVLRPVASDKDVRFYLDTLDVLFAVLRGTVKEHLLVQGFDKINDIDLADWLRRHKLELDDNPDRWPAILRAVYAGCFAFVDGDTQKPRMAAGRAVQGAVRCVFFYGPNGFSKRPGDGALHGGSVLFRMQAGMGDTVIAPLYEVLKARGVQFRFFTAVSELCPDAAGTRIAALELLRQVEVDPAHEPVRNLPWGAAGRVISAWSTEPPWDAIVDCDAFVTHAGGRHEALLALEHGLDPPANTGVRETLTVAEGDQVILAVPPDVQRRICARLVELDPNYAQMLKSLVTVMTQALQVWIDRSPTDLGQAFPSNSLMSSFVEPWDTYCDMSHLLVAEKGGEAVHHLAYFCGVLRDAGVSSQAEADAAAQRGAAHFLDSHVPRLWPGRTRPGSGKKPTPFTTDMLVGRRTEHGHGVASKGGIQDQYVRANWSPSERYTLTLPDSVRHRLGPRGTRFDNLVLAGDWTRNSFDAGCVEAAVTSGMQASWAICGGPPKEHIHGLNGPPGFPNHWDGDAKPPVVPVSTGIPPALLGPLQSVVRWLTALVRRLFGR